MSFQLLQNSETTGNGRGIPINRGNRKEVCCSWRYWPTATRKITTKSQENR